MKPIVSVSIGFVLDKHAPFGTHALIALHSVVVHVNSCVVTKLLSILLVSSGKMSSDLSLSEFS